jgi:hypothetical protein
MNNCPEYRALKQDYESALQEEALYERRGAAALRQAIRYKGEAKAVCVAARDHLIAHSEDCPICEANRE